MRDKVVIVTGGGGPGCGRAIARRFASKGASVVIADVDTAGGLITKAVIDRDGGRAAFVPVDLSKPGDIRKMVDFTMGAFGRVDVLVNNASFPYHPQEKFDYWAETVLVDLVGSMQATLACLEPMRQAGGGAIVNMASVSAIGHGRKHAEVPAFDVAKAGLIRLTTALGFLVEPDNIRVNCLVPGWIATPEVQSYADSLTPEQRTARGVPKTLQSTDQIAGAVYQLATDQRLAGRVMVWWNDEEPGLIPVGDAGYERLEPVSVAD
jgi:NAD(P)-dependent dehydrogenase (short-subunit alcohol dehydrogenase family)